MRSVSLIVMLLIASPAMAGRCVSCVKQQVVKQVVVQEIVQVPQIVKVQNFYQAQPGYYSPQAQQAYGASVQREMQRLLQRFTQLSTSGAQYAQYAQPQYQQPQYQPIYQPPQQQCQGNVCQPPASPQQPDPRFSRQAPPQSVIAQRCAKCHVDKQSGDVDLRDPPRLSVEQKANVLGSIRDGVMPKDSDQLSVDEQIRIMVELMTTEQKRQALGLTEPPPQ